MNLIRVLVNTAVLSITIPLAVGIYQWLKGGSLLVKLVLIFVAFIALVEALGLYTAYIQVNNHWVSHVYIPIEFGLLSLIYYHNLDNKGIKAGLPVAVVVFTIFCVIDVYYIESMRTFNSYPRILESGLLITLALLYFNKIFQKLDQLYLERDPMFLLSAGVIIYFAGSVSVYGLLNLMVAHSEDYTRMFLSITYVLNIAFNLLLALVLWRARGT